MKIVTGLLGCLFALLLSACGGEHNYAPVTEITSIEAVPATGAHKVVAGETVYEIAWRYGLDYRNLAAINHISPPYSIQVGQIIYLQAHQSSAPKAPEPAKEVAVLTPVAAKPVVSLPPPKDILPLAIESNYSHTGWIWPAKGKIINGFSGLNKGVNIEGTEGEPVYAAAAGKVVYCGEGLRAYGKLIILKHNSIYLSAYAHNRKLYVREGDHVRQGQKIAEMGSTGAKRTMLHFEIRKAGRPVNPLSLYKKKQLTI